MEAVAGIIITILAALFGMERIRRRNADRRADEAEAGKHRAEAEKRAIEAGLKAERTAAEKVREIDDDIRDYGEAVTEFNKDRG